MRVLHLSISLSSMILASPIYGAVLTRDTADLNSAVTKRWYGEMDKREAAWIICLNVFRNQRKAREDDWAAYQAARVSCEGQFGHDIGSVLDTNYDLHYHGQLRFPSDDDRDRAFKVLE
ncbi:hypothetical protein F4821DRAFT_265882 [Hypoxylon rubiginosum]|uniref:Uncharacterized protein n=1 Tax=Hypoxylon rubiginosum TaxID=110542 RepID=A0ACC0CJ41_9PEZI|nr:hypothetical protein F4821DRAFT_265882 [Hypoxylon rubiginosum]